MNNLYKKYESLLSSEASLNILDESINLMRKSCVNLISIENNGNYRKYSDDYIELITKKKEIIVNWVSNETEHYIFDSISKISAFTKNKSVPIWLSNLVVCLNLIPEYLNINEERVSEKDFSFITDITFLIFHNAYFAFLPKFVNQRKVYDTLIKIFLEYSIKLNRPEEIYRIKAMCFEAHDNKQLANEFYYKSLIATSSDDPVFKVSLQDYWSFLIENGNIKDALDFLLKVRNEKLIKDTEHYNELIHATFRIVSKSKNKVHWH